MSISRYGLFALVLLLTFAAGYETHRREALPLALRQRVLGLGEMEEKPPAGFSFVPAPAPPGGDAAAIGTLGYLGGYREASERDGVTIHDPDLAGTALNLYVSGHAPEAILIDMEGRVLHRWRHDFEAQWPDTGPLPYFGTEGQTYFRRAHIFPNGDLLAIYEGFGLVKLDRDSNVLWARSGGYHHDLQVTPDGSIFVLDRDIHTVARWNERLPLVEDFVTRLSSGGDVIERTSILGCFDRSDHSAVLENVERGGDVFHTNTLQVLDAGPGAPDPFRTGRVLVSIRQLNVVALLDLESRRVAWTLVGLWKKQHQPELLPGPRLLVFDNQGRQGKARVVEIDALTQKTVWSWEGSPDAPLESHVLGSCQRLPNGNTLITESTNGRAVEVTPGGRIVWEFRSPHRAGDDDELVANLFEMLRLDPDFPAAWIAS